MLHDNENRPSDPRATRTELIVLPRDYFLQNYPLCSLHCTSVCQRRCVNFSYLLLVLVVFIQLKSDKHLHYKTLR